MKIKRIYKEYGLDFDNHKYGFGKSVEIEYADGTECRTYERIRLKTVRARYVRIWIGRRVFIIDSDRPHFSSKTKSRRNFKIVFGISGI